MRNAEDVHILFVDDPPRRLEKWQAFFLRWLFFVAFLSVAAAVGVEVVQVAPAYARHHFLTKK